MSENGLILIVDDERVNLNLLGTILKDAEFESIQACDGIEALEKLTAHRMFDVIILDWMMPNMDGMQLLKKLKADQRYCEIPVIMQTALGNHQKVREAKEAGAHSYLVKPYSEEAILNAVKEAQHHTKRKQQW